MIRKRLKISSTKDEALDNLLQEMRSWLVESKKRHSFTKWKGIHDEGTYLTSWREYYLLTQDENVRDYAFERFDACKKWARRHFRRGYWKKQEVHHGVEHFIIYLSWLLEVDPKHSEVMYQLKNAANHIVEKQKKKTPWYDNKNKRFRSVFLGCKRSGSEYLNVVEHLRLVRLGWLGYKSGGNTALRDFIIEYSTEWANEILDNEKIPLFLEKKGKETGMFSKLFEKLYKTFVGAAPKSESDRARSEIHIANGSPALFIQLYKITKNIKFLDAAEKILKPLLSQLTYPYAHPLADLLYGMYKFNRFSSLPKIISKINYEKIYDDLNEGYLEFHPKVNWNQPKYSWLRDCVGMRADMAEVILYNHEKKKLKKIPSPATFNLIYRLNKNEICRLIATEISKKVLECAREIHPDGRHHGCGSRTVSAYCVGHGRNWSAGYVSTALRGHLQHSLDGLPLPDINLNPK
ncbi:MAG: hypothetical protein GF364_05960 [Candidatus Lokiarchaeota archaeon]|nr:hypothetical protein [Candidatus Lokiarchaeota archaeon]